MVVAASTSLPAICPFVLCADRANPKSREGRLRRDRVAVIVGDVLTADDHRTLPACRVEQAAGDASGAAAGNVPDAAAHAGVLAAGGVDSAAGDTRPKA